MMDSTIIEPSKKEDLNQISEICNQYYLDDQGKPDLEGSKYFTGLIEQSIDGTGTDPTEFYLTAKDGENNILGIIGYRNSIKKFTSFTKTSNPLEIYVLFVDKNHTKQGIGRNLISYLKNVALEKRYTEFIVRSASLFKESSWEFYKKIGFEDVGSIQESTGGESKIFRLIL